MQASALVQPVILVLVAKMRGVRRARGPGVLTGAWPFVAEHGPVDIDDDVGEEDEASRSPASFGQTVASAVLSMRDAFGLRVATKVAT